MRGAASTSAREASGEQRTGLAWWCHGQWSTVNDQRSTVNGQRSTVHVSMGSINRKPANGGEMLYIEHRKWHGHAHLGTPGRGQGKSLGRYSGLYGQGRAVLVDRVCQPCVSTTPGRGRGRGCWTGRARCGVPKPCALQVPDKSQFLTFPKNRDRGRGTDGDLHPSHGSHFVTSTGLDGDHGVHTHNTVLESRTGETRGEEDATLHLGCIYFYLSLERLPSCIRPVKQTQNLHPVQDSPRPTASHAVICPIATTTAFAAA